jgi:uncharacterized protein (DUF302 family)
MKRASGVLSTVLILGLLLVTAIPTASALENGLIKTKSDYSMPETIDRLKKGIVAKGITFFSEIDQAKLAADNGVVLNPSTLLIFGNPKLGSQFITSEPSSGIDWPVRLLVFEDKAGQVWTIHDDFAYIAQRHRITDRDEAFSIASGVIDSITAAVMRK